MIRAVRVYKEVGYDGMMMLVMFPHIARHQSRQAFPARSATSARLFRWWAGMVRLFVPQGAHGINS
jgi:hypothetical protein